MPREQIANRMLCADARVDVSEAPLRASSARATGQAHERRVAPRQPPDLDRRLAGALAPRAPREGAPPAGRVRPASTTTGERSSKLGLVVIDYLQLMKGRDGVNSREQEISEISARPQGAREGAGAPGHRALSAQSRGRDPEREGQAPAALATCASRAPSSRTPTTSASSTATTTTTRTRPSRTSRSSSSPSSATARPAR